MAEPKIARHILVSFQETANSRTVALEVLEVVRDLQRDGFTVRCGAAFYEDEKLQVRVFY
jgi:hypothetical protein